MLLKSRVSVQSLLLVSIGLADLISTILLLEFGMAEEANPIMSAFLPYGWVVFALVKSLTLAAYVCTLTWYRQRRPKAGAIVENAAVIGYIAVYCTLVARINF